MEPATGSAALAYISAGAAAIGGVKAASDLVSPATNAGFLVSNCHVHYPMEFPTDQFAHAGHSIQWDVIKFAAYGSLWNNFLTVNCYGYLSYDTDPLVGRPSSAHPNKAVNRFMVLTFGKSGTSENMSSGLLTVNITPWGGDAHIAEGTPEDPWLALRVEGHFDPVGEGDIQYSFKLGINSHQQIHLSEQTWQGAAARVELTQQSDHINVALHQHN